jgi:uridine phosphorylase
MKKEDIPLFFGNPKDKSLLTPEQYLKDRKHKDLKINFPKKAIFISGGEIEDYFKKTANIIYEGKFSDETLWIMKKNGEKIIVWGAKMGGTGIAAQTEELTAKEVNQIIFVGSAGAINENLDAGEIIIPDKAIRDEGLSYHYMKPSKYSYPNKELSSKLIKNARERNLNFKVGGTWTTDAFYRETFRKRDKFRKEGILSVEMEAASLFAVAKQKNIKVASIFVISDTHKKKDWNLQFHTNNYKKSVGDAFELALEVLR